MNDELEILSFYRASELAGAVLCGRLALHTDVEELRGPLTEQCAEEAEHAWLITELIGELGYVPLKVSETFQSEMAREFGMPTTALEILALTQVLENRVLDHYRKHASMEGVHPRISERLGDMVRDAEAHVTWVEREVSRLRTVYGDVAVDEVLARARAADERAYRRFTRERTYLNYFGPSL
ncbi:MAG TPA: ferritin-like domain-containing protein [Chloroflexota bacterium]|nr:ferritin-like domain-containing protein [Chloroflexota bacterium]